MQKTPLKVAREARNWTQKDIADRLGLSQGHYNRIERTGNTTRETAKAIVELFGADSELTEMHVLYPDRYRGAAA